MTKPSITKRAAKGSPLTYSELDQNFDNLRDATVTLQAGSGGTEVVSDLNGKITLVAGSGISLSGSDLSKTITITNTGSGGGFYDNGLVFGTGAHTTLPGQSWQANYNNGSVQRVELESGYWQLTPPSNMLAGNALELLFMGTGTAYQINIDNINCYVATNREQGYFENKPLPLTVYPDNWARMRIIYDGDYYWIIVDSNFYHAYTA